MSDALDLIYWDACLFYERLKKEPVDPYKAQALEECLNDNKDKRNRVCTSVITHGEVFAGKLPPSEDDAYWRFFNTKFFFDIEISRQTVLLAREIRTFYFKDAAKDGEHRLMSLGDSIHLATAITENVTALWTRDKKTKGGNVPLVGLPESSPSGKLCGVYPLKIINPVAAQIRLDVHQGQKHTDSG